jgi:hypothetical protein
MSRSADSWERRDGDPAARQPLSPTPTPAASPASVAVKKKSSVFAGRGIGAPRASASLPRGAPALASFDALHGGVRISRNEKLVDLSQRLRACADAARRLQLPAPPLDVLSILLDNRGFVHPLLASAREAFGHAWFSVSHDPHTTMAAWQAVTPVRRFLSPFFPVRAWRNARTPTHAARKLA